MSANSARLKLAPPPTGNPGSATDSLEVNLAELTLSLCKLINQPHVTWPIAEVVRIVYEKKFDPVQVGNHKNWRNTHLFECKDIFVSSYPFRKYLISFYAAIIGQFYH